MAKTAILRRLSDADLRLLRVFRAVVACGGVSAAELELNIGRSTISRHLTDLETRLGVRLCHRGPSGFSLTEEGKRIHDATLELFSAVHHFQAEVDETNRELTGHLALAFFDKNTSNPIAHLPTAIAEFARVAPKVEIAVHVEPINVIEAGVLNGQYQVGIVPMHNSSDNLDYFSLYHEQMYLYCGVCHPLFRREDRLITAEDMQNQKYASFDFHSPNMVASHDLQLKRRAIVNNEEAMLPLILSGHYIGFLPDHMTKLFAHRDQMRAILPDLYSYKSDHFAITRRTPKMSRRVETFMECLKKTHKA